MTEHAVIHAKARTRLCASTCAAQRLPLADDVAKLEDLRSGDVISEEEFQRAKAKALA